MRKIKILAVSYLFPNQAMPDFGIFVLNRLKAVSKYCEVTVINPIPWFPACERFSRYKGYNQVPYKEKIDGIDVYHPRFFIIPRFFKIIDCFSFAIAVLRLWNAELKNREFDIVDLHWTYPDILSGIILSKIIEKKISVTIRGREALFQFIDNEGEYIEETSARNKILTWLFADVHGFVTLSDELKALCRDKGVHKHRILTIRNGVDIDEFYYIDMAKCRKKLDLPLDKKIILSVGSINFRKGHDRLIRSLKSIRENNIDAIAYIVGAPGGDGDYSMELIDLVESLGLKPFVKFSGAVNNQDLVYWYNAADLFCLLSRGEGSPNVLTEALACGCPSFATDVGAVKEIINADFLGEVVSNDDKQVGSKVDACLVREYDRRMIASHMRQFGWDWCAQKVVDYYQSLLGEKFENTISS